MDILRPWETLVDETLYETGRLRLARETVRLQDGRVVKDYYQIHMGVAAVIAATRADGKLILVRMYKHGPRRHGIGFPGGGVEPGEDPVAAAQRELREETGYGGGSWRPLGGYAVHSNQGCGHVHFFMAENVAHVGEPMTEHDLEPHEFVFLDRTAVRRAVAGQDFLSLGHVCMATLWLNATGGSLEGEPL